MPLASEMFRFQLPSPITDEYAARPSHVHCIFLVILGYILPGLGVLFSSSWAMTDCTSSSSVGLFGMCPALAP